MFLLDTNIWLERLLNQAESATVGRLLDSVPLEQLSISDFSLHSIGVILGRLKQHTVFAQFVQDVLIEGGVSLHSLSPSAMQPVVGAIEQFGLDFDDAYQYVVALEHQALIVSFDKDFDRTDQGRQTPQQILASIEDRDQSEGISG